MDGVATAIVGGKGADGFSKAFSHNRDRPHATRDNNAKNHGCQPARTAVLKRRANFAIHLLERVSS